MKVKLSRDELYELVWSMPMTKASKQLGISEGTSKSQLARARVILQERLKQLETLSHEPVR